jgi:hypothetical protein
MFMPLHLAANAFEIKPLPTAHSHRRLIRHKARGGSRTQAATPYHCVKIPKANTEVLPPIVSIPTSENK